MNQYIEQIYNYTANPLTSIIKPQYILVIRPINITFTTPDNHFCEINIELYFKNGSRATLENS